LQGHRIKLKRKKERKEKKNKTTESPTVSSRGQTTVTAILLVLDFTEVFSLAASLSFSLVGIDFEIGILLRLVY